MRRALALATGYLGTAGAVAASAFLGARAVDPDSTWYRKLDKPRWQPPPKAFGAIWTPLYASIAAACGYAMTRGGKQERKALARALGVDLAINTSWNWLFFAARSPGAGLLATAALDAANVEMVRRTAPIDRRSAAALVPYVGWCAFATVLNAEIYRRNRGTGRGLKALKARS